ncbi:hypothetical protein JTB14_020622 [Gonioctena quinquepunctata]|nr:hypothetical protein JTB14_020622 [Gonioctena quinquepunctata]
MKKIELQGCRIVDIQHFIDSLIVIGNHAPHFGCSVKNLEIVKETRRGLASKITFKCNMCMSLETVTTVSDYEDVNKRAVLGITNVGSGYTHLNEFHSTMNILSCCNFEKVENLRKDILNSPKYILGDHTKCSKFFCRKETVDTTTVADMKLTPLYDKLMEFVRYLANQ